MPDANPTELLSLNCGRCGRSLKIQLEVLGDKRTVECPECEKKLPASGNAFPAPLSLAGSVRDRTVRSARVRRARPASTHQYPSSSAAPRSSPCAPPMVVYQHYLCLDRRRVGPCRGA